MTPEGRVAQRLKSAIKCIGGVTRKVSWEGRNNAPDLLCMANGRHCLVETKAPGGAPRRGQVIEMIELRVAGGFITFVVDGDDGIASVVGYLNGVQSKALSGTDNP